MRASCWKRAFCATACLGVRAAGLGEAARPAGVHLDERPALEGVLEVGVVAAGRLVDQPRDPLHRSDPAPERTEAAGIVGKACLPSAGVTGGIEMVFGDIDANGKLGHLFRSHACLQA